MVLVGGSRLGFELRPRRAVAAAGPPPRPLKRARKVLPACPTCSPAALFLITGGGRLAPSRPLVGPLAAGPRFGPHRFRLPCPCGCRRQVTRVRPVRKPCSVAAAGWRRLRSVRPRAVNLPRAGGRGPAKSRLPAPPRHRLPLDRLPLARG